MSHDEVPMSPCGAVGLSYAGGVEQGSTSFEAPSWFTTALEADCEQRSVVVDGARINVRCWGLAGPGVTLVHGGAAHARWWDHIAPLLARDYRVVAVDLSGHGDSDQRPDYELSRWADEVIAAGIVGGIEGPPIVVGHSMGGWVSATVGSEHGGEVAGVVLVDSPIRYPTPEERAASQGRAFGPLRRYGSREEAVSHFRTVPDAPNLLPYVLAHVAEHSVTKVDGAWSWKFDPRIFDRKRPAPQLLTRIECRVAVFRAEFGLVTPDVGAQMHELLGRVAPVIEIPLAGHHTMLDQPLPLLVGIRTILADWELSRPFHRSEREAVAASDAEPKERENPPQKGEFR